MGRTKWLVCALALAWCGCENAEPATVTVRGTVLYRGQPLHQGVIAFVSDPQRSRHQILAVGTIRADGRFVLSRENSPGIPPGWYKVSVLSLGEPRLPEHYGDPERSGLVCEVLPQPEIIVCFRLE
jgi:hypothetical protein